MKRRRPTGPAAVAAILAALIVTPSAARSAGPTSRELRGRAAEFSYNLDHDEAIRLLRQAVAADPNDPENHRALASSIWLYILFLRGAVTVDHYLGSLTRARVDLKKPPAELDADFRREVERAIGLSERRVAALPADPQAHYDLGTAVGLEASYMASVDGKLLAGFRAARRSYDEQERVLELDARRKDAGLIVGTYRYLVSTLSLPMRMIAYVAGFGGGKERGIRMVEECASAGGENQTDAQFALVLLYNRERRFTDAIRVLNTLRRRYPRNRLVLLESGSTAIRAGHAADADAALTEGITALARDKRPRIPGEEALWHYKRGAARVLLHQRDAALTDLRAALARPDAAGWVQGRTHVELAKLALQEGDRTGAERETAAAIAACEKNGDAICVAEAKNVK